jgi:hypothetical protein
MGMVADDETDADVRIRESEKKSVETATLERSRADETLAQPSITKLSPDVTHKASDRLRQLAYKHRLRGSSIAEAALAMFFSRGDDAPSRRSPSDVASRLLTTLPRCITRGVRATQLRHGPQ